MVTETITVVRASDRIEVTLNRPAARNAINRQIREELTAIVAELETDPRFLIITGGTDGIFAAGADIGELRERSRHETLLGPTARLFDRLARLPLPTVAAIDGPALGGGAELALACDLRLASPRLLFGFPEPRLGAVAGAGGCYRLARLAGHGLATQMLLGGRQLNATESLDRDLVLDVVPPAELLTTAHALVDRMARMSGIALRMTKTALSAPEGAHPSVDLLAQAVLVGDEDRERRMSRFFEKSGSSRS
jgi:enoyl-CoA hydratase/carnithine racemase